MATYIDPIYSFMQTYKPNGLVGIVGSRPGSPNFRLDFAANTAPSDELIVTNAASVWDWIPLPPSAISNVMGFIQAVMADTTIPTSAQMGLTTWYPQLHIFVNQPPILQSGWANLILTFESTWLTSQVQTSVLAYALEFNIPLV